MIPPHTLLLEKVLKDHKEKENRNYLHWETLRKKLDRGRSKFGLTVKSTWQEVKTAVEPHLREGMLLSEHFGQGYFSAEMTFDELRKELTAEREALTAKAEAEKTKFLHDRLLMHKSKEKKSYMKFTLTVAEKKRFDLSAQASASVLKEKCEKYIGSELQFIEKQSGKTKALYLVAKVPPTQFILESIQGMKKAVTPKAIADDVPMSPSDFIVLFNTMLASGQVQVRIDEKLGVKYGAASNVAPPKPPVQAAPDANDYEEFRRAFERLDQGRIYVRICDLRRALGWSKERFDTLVRQLRKDSIVQLHAGDRTTMSPEDVDLSYTDEYNNTYYTLRRHRK